MARERSPRIELAEPVGEKIEQVVPKARLMGAPALRNTLFMTPGGMPTRTAVLHELEPVVGTNLNRHLGVTRDWHPHDYVPWSRGRDFAFLGGEDWQPDQSPLSPLARDAMVLNLLTEDNLPSYHRTIAEQFSRDGAWGEWVGRWTAEEGRHAIAMRDYLVTTRGVDPVALEQARMLHMTNGYDAGDKDPLSALAYVSFQELATRVSHRNTGKACNDQVADKLLARVAMDENLHMVFYRNLTAAALDIAPNQTMRAITKEVTEFKMPGSDMPNFGRMAVNLSRGGIYNIRQHKNEVIAPILKVWNVFDRTDLSDDGEVAREELSAFMDKLEAKAVKFDDQQARSLARQATEKTT